MFLSISTQHHPASDLGFLFHKHPDRVHKLDLPFGKATVYFSELSAERSTAILQVEVDSIGLVRGWGGGGNSHEDLYVNDRPYVSSSLFSLALSKAYRSAMNGVSKERPELALSSLPFDVYIPTLSSPLGKEAIVEVFEPLGYELVIEETPLDAKFVEWGEGRFYQVTLRNTLPLSMLLKHLYILLPVLDGSKHYWVHQDEITKLIEKGKGWLSEHPSRHKIIKRYLKNQKDLAREAALKLADSSSESSPTIMPVDKPPSLNDLRMRSVVETLKASNCSRVIDMGCGPGVLIKELLKDRQFTDILGVDVSPHALKRAKVRLGYDDLSENQKKRLSLMQGSLVYNDKRFHGYDAIALVEVIEHIEPERLSTVERVLFEFSRPLTIIITTPNKDFNLSIKALGADRMRHRDHRFEWSAQEFQQWALGIAKQYGYSVRFQDIGRETIDSIAPTQMGVFTR
ncbi:MAG: 3' terminal RNA ribose 2'-O-methyltransferase Hen1 [Proteobacteria bacterium]|nr:MAG: 3' terminal RNA ribose 2'-O-methyltransferase Hen1 [Pseudomonadota bacterium]